MPNRSITSREAEFENIPNFGDNGEVLDSVNDKVLIFDSDDSEGGDVNTNKGQKPKVISVVDLVGGGNDTLTKNTDSTESCSLELSLNGQTPLTGFGQTNDFAEKSIPSNTVGTYVTHEIRGENDGVELNVWESPSETTTGLPEQRVLVTESKVGCVRKSVINNEHRHGNTLYVDKHYNASGGIRERADTAYPSIDSANNVAVAGDTIVIRSGVYTEQLDLKDQVNYHFEAGAEIDVSNGADNNPSTSRHAITDGGKIYRGSITGRPNLTGQKDVTSGSPIVVYMFRSNGDSEYNFELGDISGYYGLYLSGKHHVTTGNIEYSSIASRPLGGGVAVVYSAQGTLRTGNIIGKGVIGVNFARRGVLPTKYHADFGNIIHESIANRNAQGAITLGQGNSHSGLPIDLYNGTDKHEISVRAGNVCDITTTTGSGVHLGNAIAETQFSLDANTIQYKGIVDTSHTGEAISVSLSDTDTNSNIGGIDAHIRVGAIYSTTNVVGVVNNASNNRPISSEKGYVVDLDIQAMDVEYGEPEAYTHFDVSTTSANDTPMQVTLHGGSWKSDSSGGSFTKVLNVGAVAPSPQNGLRITGGLVTNASGNGAYPIPSITQPIFDPLAS